MSHNPPTHKAPSGPQDEPPQPDWQGPELALAQLQDRLYQVKNAMEPERPDVIVRATNDGLKLVELLQQWLHSLPPGAIPATKHRPGERSLP